jgi:hypothetical protein
LNLEAAVSYAQLVNVNAVQLGTMKRIKPNDDANSYLMHKVNGTQVGVGGSGARMPFDCAGATCLNATEINNLLTCINGGANP